MSVASAASTNPSTFSMGRNKVKPAKGNMSQPKTKSSTNEIDSIFSSAASNPKPSSSKFPSATVNAEPRSSEPETISKPKRKRAKNKANSTNQTTQEISADERKTVEAEGLEISDPSIAVLQRSNAPQNAIHASSAALDEVDQDIFDSRGNKSIPASLTNSSIGR